MNVQLLFSLGGLARPKYSSRVSFCNVVEAIFSQFSHFVAGLTTKPEHNGSVVLCKITFSPAKEFHYNFSYIELFSYNCAVKLLGRNKEGRNRYV